MHRALLAIVALMSLSASADAQQPVRRVKVDFNGVQVGFQNASDVTSDGFKTGLWAPVLVRFVDDEQGNIKLPVAVDGSVSGELLVETADNDYVLNAYPQAFNIAANEPLQVLTYVKVSSSHCEIRITVKVGDHTFLAATKYCQGMELSQHLYLALGEKLPDLDKSLVRLLGVKNNPDNVNPNQPLHAAFENNLRDLPKLWFGFNAVDLAILSTSNGKFVDGLTGERQSSPQLEALAEWVSRGGRLVVSISPTNREKVYRLLSSTAWHPALPPVLSLDSKTVELGALDDVRNWSNTGRGLLEPFQPKMSKDGKPQVKSGVRLLANPDVSVLATDTVGDGNSVPLIVRFPHGVGSVTLIAFDVGDSFLSEWTGRFDFWQAMVAKLAPGGIRPANEPNAGNWQGMDVASGLYDELERFDTPTISFGWVALFIFLYIIIVGPVDYIILKFFVKRLELTWITFPAVVITVSLLAYFTAYAIKGQDLKVNKVDLIDIDMRSSLDEKLQPMAATVFGTTWFAILSPRIQDYTIGIEPVVYKWQPGGAAPAQPVEPTMSWFGRPEFGGFGASGRGRSPSLFSRTYRYEPNAVGLDGVPIPVWTIRSFTASWAAPLGKSNLPFDSKITVEANKLPARFDSLSGTLKSNLPFDMREVGLVYRDKIYTLADIPKGGTVQIKLDPQAERALSNWADTNKAGQWQQQPGNIRPAGEFFNPTMLLRDLMFHEQANPNSNGRNHAHRGLDWSWRLAASEGNDAAVQEIILVARLGSANGQLEQLQGDADSTLPTRLWLGGQPAKQGTLHQETYIRVILPVAPLRAP